MRFYKIIQNQNYIGVANQDDFRRFQLKHRVLLLCDWGIMQYIQYNGKLYHARWMRPIVDETVEYEWAEVVPITEDEYNILYEASGSDDELEVYDELFAPAEQPEEIIDMTYIDGLREAKIQSMSRKCNQTIVDGCDVTLSDGEAHHFTFSVEDQLNLLDAAMLINNGEITVQYHASGEICKFYTAADMKAIIDSAAKLRRYHTAYFNSLKGYINSLTDVETIAEIKYGDKIPCEYVSDVLKTFMTEQ